MSSFFTRVRYLCFVLLAASAVWSQSTDQSFPTPITSTQLNGVIKPRDLGDPRLTTYFYAFDAAQGDVFINVVAKNLSGDIDIFTLDGLQPLTKMVFYPDGESVETGRLVYLRKPEHLLLRIQGRPPGDDPATFTIKFGGSFLAVAPVKGNAPPKLPDTSAARDETGIRVNSVGTIVEVIPKKASPKEALERKAAEKVEVGRTHDAERKAETDTAAIEKTPVAALPEAKPKTKPQVVVTEAPEVATVFGGKRAENASPPASTERKSPPTVARRPPRSAAATKNPPVKSPPVRPPEKTASTQPEKTAGKPPDPMANIRLVVQLKTGETIDKPMTEITRFSVDRGVLTVVSKDGKISRYPILDVSKMTVERP